jgi:hypothetical protein
MVYAIIYSLFLGFGIAIGSDIYLLLSKAARATQNAEGASITTLEGTFTADNSNFTPFQGSFTFSNSSLTRADQALRDGSVTCMRGQFTMTKNHS